jgi:hypothetical protein
MDLRTPAGPPLKARSGYQVSIPTGSSDVVIELNGVEVMRISLGAIMSIKSQNDLSFEAPNITLKAGNSVRIEAGVSIALKSGVMMTLDSGASMALKGCGTMALKSGVSMTLDAAKVDINNGALEIV